jgi:hypothetical protein
MIKGSTLFDLAAKVEKVSQESIDDYLDKNTTSSDLLKDAIALSSPVTSTDLEIEDYLKRAEIARKSHLAIENLREIISQREDILNNDKKYSLATEELFRINAERVYSVLGIKPEEELSLEAIEEDPKTGLKFTIEQEKQVLAEAENLLVSNENFLIDAIVNIGKKIKEFFTGSSSKQTKRTIPKFKSDGIINSNAFPLLSYGFKGKVTGKDILKLAESVDLDIYNEDFKVLKNILDTFLNQFFTYRKTIKTNSDIKPMSNCIFYQDEFSKAVSKSYNATLAKQLGVKIDPEVIFPISTIGENAVGLAYERSGEEDLKPKPFLKKHYERKFFIGQSTIKVKADTVEAANQETAKKIIDTVHKRIKAMDSDPRKTKSLFEKYSTEVNRLLPDKKDGKLAAQLLSTVVAAEVMLDISGEKILDLYRTYIQDLKEKDSSDKSEIYKISEWAFNTVNRFLAPIKHPYGAIYNNKAMTLIQIADYGKASDNFHVKA